MTEERKKIRVAFILEMIGRPPEHLIKSMKEILEKIKDVQGVEIKEENVFEAKKLESKENLYSTLAEVEAVFDNLEILSEILFTYMPSHFEVIEPEEMRLKNIDITAMINKIIRRLHQADELVRILGMEKIILKNKLAEHEGTFKPEIKEEKKEEKPEKKLKKSKRKNKKKD